MVGLVDIEQLSRRPSINEAVCSLTSIMPRRKRIEEDELTSADYAAADAVYQRNPLIKVYAHGTKTQLRQVRTWWDL